ncbi:MAG: MerR family transcriptional regulator [Candidatus Tokpelaia hoelldobleri]|uniref:MerR family transcriptional regulator n=1 Tax=Candidatus Tokpelaia hoelldobleri TaxID=1902579 RepID=A0A1U9JVH3_9HYPH|nr:MAG: MerR family transcriptional regulator [Candidatus Tokpelaia hoelldoblerii]
MLLRHIHYFLAVAEHGSFTRAATALHVSQPALSQQIRQVEDMLGVQLFDRSGRTVRLTDAGEVYRHYAQQVEQTLEKGRRAIHDVANLSRGTLHIAVTPSFSTYLIGPLVGKFHNLYPNIRLVIEEMPQEQIEKLIGDDVFDLGIAFAGNNADDIEVQPLWAEALALVVGGQHPCARHETMPLEALQDENMVLLSPAFATRGQIDEACRQNGLSPHVLAEVNSLDAVIELVRKTRLSTLLPAQTGGNRKGVCVIDLEPALLQRTVALLQRKGAYQTVAARAFVQLVSEFGSVEGAPDK